MFYGAGKKCLWACLSTRSKNEPHTLKFISSGVSVRDYLGREAAQDDMQIIKHSHEDIFIVPTDTLCVPRGARKPVEW